MASDLHLDAEGELDFRSVKLKNLEMRREKKTREVRSMVSSISVFLFSLIS